MKPTLLAKTTLSRLSAAIILGITSLSAAALEDCPQEPVINYTESGIPLIETNPGAPIALYLDFDGGEFGHYRQLLSGYNRGVDEGSDGDPSTFDALEQQDIITSVTHTDQYFAMFDVNVTTDPAVRDSADAAAWIIITEDYEGGLAYLGKTSVSKGLDHARAYSAANRTRPDSSNKNRTLASELGHNFGIMHQGECVDGEFVKLSKWEGFDGQRGAIMGSGKGVVNGWRLGEHDGRNSCLDLQDDIEMIRSRITQVLPSTYSGDGFRNDDHSQSLNGSASPMCVNTDMQLQAKGILERPADKDAFKIDWAGGSMHITSTSPGVSAADLIVRLSDSEGNVLAEANSPVLNREYMKSNDLAPGDYYIEVMSHGGYGEIGSYELLVQDESADLPASGRLEIAISSSSDDAEEGADGDISRSSSDLELVRDDSNQLVGLRFTDIALPPGVQINNAWLQFQTDETDSEETHLTIAGEYSADPATFASVPFNISSREQTFSQVEWSPEPWQLKGERGTKQRSENIASIVQELVDSGSWMPGSNMAFILSGTGKRVAESFNGDLAGAPALIIEYGDYNSALPADEEDNTGEEEGGNDTINDEPVVNPSNNIATATINHGDDDAEEDTTGYVSQSSSDLELIDDGGAQVVGLRFTGLEVPRDATITQAYIQFTAHRASGAQTSLEIDAELSGHATHFNKNAFNVSQRELSQNPVNWRPEPWSAAGDAGVAQQTPDLSAALQAVVSHQDWLAGNAVNFVIKGEGKRVATSFNGSAANAPQLVVQYDLPEQSHHKLLSVAVSDNNDDAEQSADGNISLSSSDLELITDRGVDQVVGLRFANVALPAGAQIVDARLQFQVDETDSTDTELVISTELSHNSAPFTKSAFDLSDRMLSVDQVNWNVTGWRVKGESSVDQRSPNLATLISEVVNQPDWQNGNALTLIIQGSGKRVATSHDNNPAGAAKLLITYK